MEPAIDISENGYAIKHIAPGDASFSSFIEPRAVKYPITLFILHRGGPEITVEVNLEPYKLSKDSLLMVFPGNMVRTIGAVPTELDCYVACFDAKFTSGININISNLAIPSMSKPRKAITLDAAEAENIIKYFSLLADTAANPSIHPQLKWSIATSLTTAFFYELISDYYRRLPTEIVQKDDTPKGNRRNEYVREFIRLVHIHFTRERAVSYYAEKLCVSPKYLSMLVKDATGRTAASWINEFVLMEAKNMLRFSGKNIQQIAYALNFPTQSSFGKYFKNITGYSPTEYLKT